MAAISCGMMISATRVGASAGGRLQVQAVGVQRLGKFLAEQQAHVLSGDGPGQARHQPTERQRVVGGFAQQPPGHRRRQPLFHHDVIQQVLLRRATQSGQAGLVSHHVTNRQGCLAVGAKRRPILGNGSFVVDQPPVGQPVDDRGRHALGRREHHRRGIRRPRHPSGPISPPLPHVDDRLPVEIHRQRSATEPAPRKHAGKGSNDARKAWVRRTKHPPARVRSVVGRNRAVIDSGVNHHTVELTWISQRPSANTDLFTYPLG